MIHQVFQLIGPAPVIGVPKLSLICAHICAETDWVLSHRTSIIPQINILPVVRQQKALSVIFFVVRCLVL